MRRATHPRADEADVPTHEPTDPSAVEEITRRFFRYTALIMGALLLPAVLQAFLDVIPGMLEPSEAVIMMSLALSATIVATALLIEALVRGDVNRSSD
jgi:hypothetical protein